MVFKANVKMGSDTEIIEYFSHRIVDLFWEKGTLLCIWPDFKIVKKIVNQDQNDERNKNSLNLFPR